MEWKDVTEGTKSAGILLAFSLFMIGAGLLMLGWF